MEDNRIKALETQVRDLSYLLEVQRRTMMAQQQALKILEARMNQDKILWTATPQN